MKSCVVAILLLIFVPIVHAEVDPQAQQVDAAIDDAVARLRSDIDSQSLGGGLTVGGFITQTHLADRLMQTLHEADQVGGPRWVDDETCQVKLAIRSDAVLGAIIDAATARGRASPLPPDELAAKLRFWRGQTFTATGASISASRALMLRPANTSLGWRDVSDETRAHAIVSAREDAVNRQMDALGNFESGSDSILNAALKDSAVTEKLRAAIALSPVTRLEFTKDCSVQITLGMTGRAAAQVIADAAPLAPSSPEKLKTLRRECERAFMPAAGNASLSSRTASAGAASRKAMSQDPEWGHQAITVEAVAKYGGTRLKTARQAESAAREQLLSKVNALPLAGATIGKMASTDAAVERAVQQSIDHARIYKIDYLSDGSTRIRLSLDLQDLMDRLHEVP